MKKVLITAFFFSLFVPLYSYAQINVATQNVTATVELMWESHAYIPPFYTGRALYPVGAEVTMYALPPADLGAPNTLTYTWKKDSVVQGSLSGIGKRSYTFSGSQFGDSPLIAVEVSNGTQTAVGAVRLAQADPVIRQYPNTPLGGILFDHALPNALTTQEETFGVEAYPYFFSASSRTDIPLRYTWNIGGSTVADATGPSIAITSEQPTRINAQLTINNTAQILQRATKALTITFE